MCLLYGRVHKHRTPAAQVHGVFGKQSLFGKLFRGKPEGLCECFQKRAAPRRTRLVKHNRVYRAVFDFKALYILPAYIENKLYFGAKILCGGVMRNGFYHAFIHRKTVFYKFLAVTRNRAAAYHGVFAEQRINFEQLFLNDVHGVAFIGAVISIQQFFILAHGAKFGGGRTAVYTDKNFTLVSLYISASDGIFALPP